MGGDQRRQIKPRTPGKLPPQKSTKSAGECSAVQKAEGRNYGSCSTVGLGSVVQRVDIIWCGAVLLHCSRYQMCALHQLVLSGEQRATDASLQKVAINYLRSPSMRCLPALQKRYICHTITLNIVITILKEL